MPNLLQEHLIAHMQAHTKPAFGFGFSAETSSQPFAVNYSLQASGELMMTQAVYCPSKSSNSHRILRVNASVKLHAKDLQVLARTMCAHVMLSRSNLACLRLYTHLCSLCCVLFS